MNTVKGFDEMRIFFNMVRNYPFGFVYQSMVQCRTVDLCPLITDCKKKMI